MAMQTDYHVGTINNTGNSGGRKGKHIFDHPDGVQHWQQQKFQEQISSNAWVKRHNINSK